MKVRLQLRNSEVAMLTDTSLTIVEFYRKHSYSPITAKRLRDKHTGALLVPISGWIWEVGHRGFGRGGIKRIRKRITLCREGQEKLVRWQGTPSTGRRGRRRAEERATIQASHTPTHVRFSGDGLTYIQLRDVARYNGLVVWHKSHILERLVIGHIDGAVLAEGPGIPMHPIKKHGMTYACEAIRPTDLIRIGDLNRCQFGF